MGPNGLRDFLVDPTGFRKQSWILPSQSLQSCSEADIAMEIAQEKGEEATKAEVGMNESETKACRCMCHMPQIPLGCHVSVCPLENDAAEHRFGTTIG